MTPPPPLRRFRRETGATPHAYAMQYRLRLARRALPFGDTVAGVAAAFGFADQPHLPRAFARQSGLPPAAGTPPELPALGTDQMRMLRGKLHTHQQDPLRVLGGCQQGTGHLY
ncbi:helix-turn-helix domain-containing protein [Tropicimonas omnivorans]|uniref:helix-turn-helix domain-containing protein n=1 Tax=Tropicimonas omnivorans TaxID=3075590 RepID=UPI003D76ECCF